MHNKDAEEDFIKKYAFVNTLSPLRAWGKKLIGRLSLYNKPVNKMIPINWLIIIVVSGKLCWQRQIWFVTVDDQCLCVGW